VKRRQFLATALASAARPLRAQATSKVVAVGDVHGDLDRFVDVLTMAGIVGDRQEWTGGSAQLVTLGDLVDRGARSREVIELLIRLDKEAKKARGRVWCLVGNHEAMRMQGDLRYIAAAEYEAYTTKKSEQEREKSYQLHLKIVATGDDRTRPDLSPGYRQKWEKEHPLGQAELQKAWAPDGPLGRWAVQQRAVLKLDESLFVHGGISPKYAEWSESRFNDRIREELQEGLSLKAQDGVSRDAEGPLWWRGLAQDTEEMLAPHVDQLLAKHKVRRIIIGHTPTQGRGVVSRLGGKLILADVGLSEYYGARRACVVIENGQAFALDRGQRIQLT